MTVNRDEHQPSHDSWKARLEEMESWYGQLLARSPEEAEAALGADYAPYAAALSQLRGRIIDVGGGAGVAGRYLDRSCYYAVIDPSPLWHCDRWSDFARQFRKGGAEPEFIFGVGEELPFPDASFDAALSFWSLNHARAPREVMREIGRVLVPGGLAIVVLEDMEPSWVDVLAFARQQLNKRVKRRTSSAISWGQPAVSGLRETILRKLKPGSWPLQEDHVPVSEPAFLNWIRRDFHMLGRSWNGGFLCFTLRRRLSIRPKS